MKKLGLDEENGKIFGVCSGIARYLNIDMTIIRIIVLCWCLLDISGVIMYFIAAICMPKITYVDDKNISKEDKKE